MLSDALGGSTNQRTLSLSATAPHAPIGGVACATLLAPTRELMPTIQTRRPGPQPGRRLYFYTDLTRPLRLLDQTNRIFITPRSRHMVTIYKHNVISLFNSVQSVSDDHFGCIFW
ncbi:MAG: hypothetical protein RJB39_442 [Candidatus Parcubacteria bacterium]